MRLLRPIRLFGHYIAFNLRAGMEYRTSFFVQIFGMIANNTGFAIFWMLLYQRIGSAIRGYAFSDVMFLWALASAGFGMSVVFLGNSGMISRIIYRGELDVYLLQPKPVLPNLLASRMVASGWGDLAYGILLFFISQHVTLGGLALFLLFAVLMCLVFTALKVIYHSLTFFFGNAEDFAVMANEVTLSMTLYPGSIFEGPVKIALFTLFPAGVIAYIPVSLFRSFDPARLLLVIAADAAFVLVAFLVFARGLRFYESGSRMGIRL